MRYKGVNGFLSAKLINFSGNKNLCHEKLDKNGAMRVQMVIFGDKIRAASPGRRLCLVQILP